MNKTVLTSFTILCLLSTVFLMGLSFNIKAVVASGTIYIRADGSIDPPTANLSTISNVTYTFTDNINDSIVIERDNVVIDGMGYFLDGNGNETGIDLTDRIDVTIKNVRIKEFNVGISALDSSDIIISGNIVEHNAWCGVSLAGVHNITILNNGLSENTIGLRITSQIFPFNKDVVVSNNTISNNVHYGIRVEGCQTGIFVNNIVRNNGIDGVVVRYAEHIEVLNNTMTGNFQTGIWLVESEALVHMNRIAHNRVHGIYVSSSIGVEIIDNVITNSSSGITLHRSNNSLIRDNVIMENDYAGMFISESCNNHVYHNSLISNKRLHGSGQVYSGQNLRNIWDNGYPCGGNYWSDYAGIDLYRGFYQNETGYDWIGDSPYIIDANNQDNYPLILPKSVSEETKIAYRNLLLKYNMLLSDFETLNSTLHEQIDLLTSSYINLQTSVDDLLEQVVFLNSTLQISDDELQGRIDSVNSTLTSGQEDIISQLNNLQNLMYVFIATTMILIATTVYLAIRKPRTKP